MHRAGRRCTSRTVENRAEDIQNAIEKEQAALDWLDRTPPHFGDSFRRMEEALQSLNYATQYLGWDNPVYEPLNEAIAADKAAQAVDTNIWPKAKAEKKIEAALALKKKALPLERAEEQGREGCTLSYPPAVAPAETTIDISGCIEPVGSVKLTFPFGVAKVTNYGVTSPGAFVSGTCTKEAKSISCALGDPWNPEALFFVAVSPQVKPGEQIGVDLVPFKSGGQPWHFGRRRLGRAEAERERDGEGGHRRRDDAANVVHLLGQGRRAVPEHRDQRPRRRAIRLYVAAEADRRPLVRRPGAGGRRAAADLRAAARTARAARHLSLRSELCDPAQARRGALRFCHRHRRRCPEDVQGQDDPLGGRVDDVPHAESRDTKGRQRRPLKNLPGRRAAPPGSESRQSKSRA